MPHGKSDLLSRRRNSIIIIFVLLCAALALAAVFAYIGHKIYAENISISSAYEEQFTEMVETEGVERAIASIKEQYRKNWGVKAYCHPIMHAIGRSAVWTGKSNVSTAFAEGDSFCWSGYYHGVMEGLLYRLKNNNSTMIISICEGIKAKREYSFDHYNCVHGLGHGIMYINNNNITISLPLCKNLSDWWERESCYGGVFMENIISDNDYHLTVYLKKDDLIYPCTIVDAAYKNACYLMQTSWMLEQSSGDFRKVFGLCRGIEREFRNTCFQSLGRDASGRNYGYPRNVKRKCLLGEEGDEQAYCIIGAAADMVSYYYSDKEALEFCTLLSGNLSMTCKENVALYAAYLP